MLRNEDRLYHIVVSFPSICAKQFLILRIKKNEAICCLIGFGIGIGCCLMYRWLRNSFLKTEFFYNIANNRLRYEPVRSIQSCASRPTTSSDLQLMTIDDNHTLVRKSKNGVPRNKKKPKLRTSAAQLLGNKYSTLASVSRTASKNVSKYLLSQPLSMIYENIAKYLAKEFYKNAKLKRPALKEKPKSKHLKRNLVSKSHGTSDTSPFRSLRSPVSLAGWSNMLASGSKELCLSRKLKDDKTALLSSLETMLNTNNSDENTKMIQRKRAFLNDLNNRSLVYHLRLQQQRSKTSSNPFLSKVSKHEFEAANKSDLSHMANSPNHANSRRLHDYLNGDPLSLNNNCLFASKKSLLNPHNRSLFDELSPSLGLEINSASKSDLDSLYRSNSQMLTDLGIGYDEELQELFLNSSHRSSIYDFDDSTDSKSTNPMTKADNYVDKSLEEALHHIDKLKEDMNHLCKDIDSLYNIKGGSGEFTSENAVDNYKLSYINNEDEELDHIKSLIDSNSLIESNDLVNESMKHLKENLEQFKSKRQLIDQLSRTLESCDEVQRCTCAYSDNFKSPDNDCRPSSHDYFHCKNNFCPNSIHNASQSSSSICNESLVPKAQSRLVNPVHSSSRIMKRTLLNHRHLTLPTSSSRSLRKSSSFHKKSSSHYCSLSARMTDKFSPKL